MTTRHKPSQIGGQKSNQTATVAAALALLYLQQKYPGTFIQGNPSQVTGDPPHDIEQWENRDMALWAIRAEAGVPLPWWVKSQSLPLRLSEVKGLLQRSKRFKINVAAHRRLMRRQTGHGVFYIFVLFTVWNYSGRQLHCEYRIKEISGKRITRLVAQPNARKMHKLKRNLPRYLWPENTAVWIPWTVIFKKGESD